MGTLKQATLAAAVCVALSGVVQAFRPAVIPAGCAGHQGSPRPIHQLAIVALGLPLIDVMDLEAAAETAARLKRWEFLVTAAAVAVLGGTGFPLNPIATF